MANSDKLEEVLDLVATRLIESDSVNPDKVLLNQKTVKEGLLKIGRQREDKVILYQTDIRANQADLSAVDENLSANSLEGIVELLGDNPFDISVTAGQIFIQDLNTNWTENITTLLSSEGEDGVTNPLNVGQFLNFETTGSYINPEQANEFLDTNIFELLPRGSTRQDRIDNFFQEFDNLKGDIPDFANWDGDDLNLIEPEIGYESEHDIAYSQQNNLDQEDKFITRLQTDATDSDHSGQSLQSMRDSLDEYLQDIDQSVSPPQDQRPEYENKSEGYLKFRNLNQGIIIRNTDRKFIQGLDPDSREYLTDGFTITMWVRFLDNSSEGTLFNFGNPIRENNPFGIRLETFIGSDDRYIRLLVLDNDGIGAGSTAGTPRYYDSHVGTSGYNKLPTPTVASLAIPPAVQNLKIPYNYSEWYFICATYSPNVNEINSFSLAGGWEGCTGPCDQDPDFWRGNILYTDYTHYSGYGNRSKVEIISKSDLLRARGYKA